MMSRAFTVLLASLLVTLSAARLASAGDAAVVSAAASLKNAFEEIGALPAAGAKPAFNFGSSGDLAAQIRGGAPVDVFASAAAMEMDALEAEGALLPGTRADFAANAVVLIVPAGSAAVVSSFADLAKPAVARIAVGNPRTVPAGRYAAEVFASSGVAEGVQSKLVMAENVRQVLDYVARGEVEAGVVYATDAAVRPHDVRVAAVAPAGSHGRVVYPVAILSGAAHRDAAKAFVAAVRSAAGQAILTRHGFLPAPRGK
jgi:molybdate transport system substrate-binding protein